MGKRNVKQELHNNVQPLDNDFIRSNPNAKSIKKGRKAVLLRRRLAVFFVITVVTIVALVKYSSILNERLTEKEQKKQEVTSQLEEAVAKQELLNLQIAKLEDDEYIAKLARKEFFLSEEGEIIFTIPKSDEKDENVEASNEQDGE